MEELSERQKMFVQLLAGLGLREDDVIAISLLIMENDDGVDVMVDYIDDHLDDLYEKDPADMFQELIAVALSTVEQ